MARICLGYNSTNITMLNESIEQFAADIAKRFAPEKIILFGSQAQGSATSDSDVDVLVLMDFHGTPAQMAAKIRSQVDHPFPLDLLVRRPADVAWRIAQNDFFLRDIFTIGKVLYDSSH